MIFVDILLSFLAQIAVTLGAIFAFGFLIALCNRRFYANFGSKAQHVCYITGFVGTPVHECSHALFCLIFFHKITEIKLFQINADDGTLGYVSHSYNPKNIYQKAGNLFIGIAPIVVIAALLYLFARLIMPETMVEMSVYAGSLTFAGGAEYFFETVFDIIKTFFVAATTWQWWVFVLVGMLFALHMTLSGADIKGALSGLVIVLVAIFVVDVILGLVGGGVLSSFNEVVFTAGAYLDMFLSLALIISLVALAISYIYRFTLGRIIR